MQKNIVQYLVCPPSATTTAIMPSGIDSYKDLRYNDVMFFQTFKAIHFRPAIDVARSWPCITFIWLYKFSIGFKSGLLRGHPWKRRTPFFLCCCLVDFALCTGQVCDALVNRNLTNLRIVFSRVLRDSTPRFVGPSVRPPHFTFFGFLLFLASLLLLKWSDDLNYGPCPPARDWGSRVSGLVCMLALAQWSKWLLHNCIPALALLSAHTQATIVLDW